MSERYKSQQAFIAVTMITVLAVATVFLVYAVILSTLYGGQVSVVTVNGSVWYDEANSTSAADWTDTLSALERQPMVRKVEHYQRWIRRSRDHHVDVAKTEWRVE